MLRLVIIPALNKVEHQDDFYHFGHLETDTYLRDDGEEVDENGSRDRRHRPSERHAKQKYERVQSAPNYTTSQVNTYAPRNGCVVHTTYSSMVGI